MSARARGRRGRDLALDPITVVIDYQAQPGRHEIAARKLSALVKAVVAGEPTCRGITMCVDPADPARFLLYERWSDRSYYFGPHMETAHLQQFMAEAPEFLVGAPRIGVWREVLDARPTSPRGPGRNVTRRRM